MSLIEWFFNSLSPINLPHTQGYLIAFAMLTPVVSTKDNSYKVGLWVRDSTAGIGTITYIDPETGRLSREKFSKFVDELGKTIGEIIGSGILLPDGVVMDLVEEELNKIEDVSSKNLIFDGFPRKLNEAKDALKSFMIDGSLKEAGSKVILEEFLEGFECSLLCFTDGETIVPMVSSKDHKQIYDENKGPNTGGMGTVSPNPFLEDGINEVFEKEVLIPFMNGLKQENMDFRGVIFIGLMIKDGYPKVLEFNVRFGDPETQSILLRLDSDLYDIMEAVAEKKLNTIDVKWKENHVGCLVLASVGYPNKYEKGKVITGLDDVNDDIVVFHAGTAFKDGNVVTNGGRVLNICAEGKDLDDVRCKLYQAAEKINFEGKYFRKDIGLN